MTADEISLTLTGTASVNGTGNVRDNVLTGNRGNNILSGRGGNDTLIGGGGDDILIGGTGNDIYVVDSASDQVQEFANSGIDTVRSSVTWTLGENLERLVLIGSAAINGTGNGLNNFLIGNGANNTLNGGLGNDTMTGGAGNDVFVVNVAGDLVQENLNGGTDTVRSSIAWTLGANLENLTLLGTAAVDGTGNGLANVLTGNGGSNTLSGSGGNDTLNGAGGNDRLRGGAGRDQLRGGAGADQFKFITSSEGGDTIGDFSAAEGDRLAFSSANFGRLAVGALAAGVLVSNSTGMATTRSQRFIFNTATRTLNYDADGTGVTAPVAMATLSGVNTLSASAIQIVAS
ncbi:MAG: calcium-binding protein [Magnetococcales bacterium]|nr:calcium-binding protein [Magnetococcales bacterium]